MDGNDVHSVLLLYCLSKAAVLFGAKVQVDEPYMMARNLSVVSICPGWCQVRGTRGTAGVPTELIHAGLSRIDMTLEDHPGVGWQENFIPCTAKAKGSS